MFKVPKKLLSLFIVVFHGILFGTVIDSYLHHPDLPTTMHFKVPLWWYASLYLIKVIFHFLTNRFLEMRMKKLKMENELLKRGVDLLEKIDSQKPKAPTVWQTSSNPPKPNTP